MISLPIKHSSGVEFFRFSDLESLDVQGYFECIKILTPLFKSHEFSSATPGFYLNYITNIPDDNLNSLRITYYSIDPIKSQEAIRKFIEHNSDKIVLFNSKWTGRVGAGQPLDEPNEEELSFRNFLNRNTQIVLELLENHDREELRKSVFYYRHVQLPQRVKPEQVFGKLFNGQSDYFRQLQKEKLDVEYWQGSTHLFHGRDPGLHFLINMLVLPESQYFIVSKNSLI